MNNTEMLARWARVMRDMEAQYRTLDALMGSEPEAPLPLAVNRLMEAYTDQVSAHLGDSRQWLEWYWLECDLGAKPKVAGPHDDMRRIATIEDLAWVIGAAA